MCLIAFFLFFLFFLSHYVETSSFSNEIGAGMLVNTGVCLCVLVCVFCVSPFLSPPPSLTPALSLPKRAGWYVSFSLGMAQIWQQLGLHPMQETHPTEATSWSYTMCIVMRMSAF